MCEYLKRFSEWFTVLLKCEPEGDISDRVSLWAPLSVISYILGKAGTRSKILIWNFFIKHWILDKFKDAFWTGLPNEYCLLLTPWCRVLLDKLTGLQLVNKFPAFHGTRKFITALTSLRHLSLSWANPILSIYPHPTSSRSILILSTHLRLGLPTGLLPSPPPRPYIHPLFTHTRHKPSPSHSSRTILGEE